jgi:prepilin-type N-terminal cleavage/methylation domain-containing protein
MPTLFTHASRESGFTFNEVLVAMSLVAIAVLGYFVTALSLIRGNTISDNYTVAVNLAQDKMEELKARAQFVNENRCPSAGDRGITASGFLGGAFDRCWKVADSSLGTHLKQIDVTVSWRDYENREVTISTLVYAVNL